MKKYYSAVLAIFRDEAHIIREWVEHYKARDIEHIYLLNDFSVDNFLPQIEDYIISGYVTLKNIAIEDKNTGIQHGRQVEMYNKYFSSIVDETEWIAILDLDEFLYSPEIKSLSKVFSAFDNTSIQELKAEWYHFGSSGCIVQPKNVVESFTMRNKELTRNLGIRQQLSGYQQDWCHKTIAKTKYITQLRHHYNFFNYNDSLAYSSHRSDNISFSQNLSDVGALYINHYLQSWERYVKRIKLGSCNNNRYIKRCAALYDILNHNEIEDTRLRDQNKFSTN